MYHSQNHSRRPTPAAQQRTLPLKSHTLRALSTATQASGMATLSESEHTPGAVLTALCDLTQALGVVFLQLGIPPPVIKNSTSSCRALRNLSVEFDLSSYSTLSPAEVELIASQNSTVVGVSMCQVSHEEMLELTPHLQLLRRLELSYSDDLRDFSFIEQLPCLSEVLPLLCARAHFSMWR